MPVFRSTAITSFVLTTAFAVSAAAQATQQCSVEEGKPPAVARAFLAISQIGGAQNPNADQTKSQLSTAVRALTESGGSADNPVGHAYELGKLLVLWTVQPGTPMIAQRGTIGFATDPSGTINLPAAIDSAFRIVEQAMPGCKSETIKWRSQKGWINLVNAAIQDINAGSLDSAELHARQSLLFNDQAPYGYMVLGQVAQRRAQPDTAIAMFQKTIAVAGTDSTYADVKRQTELNLASAAAEAAAAKTASPADKSRFNQIAKQTYEGLANDPLATDAVRQSAKSGLVQVQLAMGDSAAAKSSYQPQLSDPSKFTYAELLQAGVAASRVNDDSSAMQLFRGAVAANPYHRDGLSNLVIYEIRAQQYDSALTYLNRLKSVDPDGNHMRMFTLAYAGIAKHFANLNKDIVTRFKTAKSATLKKTLTDSAAITADSNRVYTELAVTSNAKADSVPVIVTFTEFSNVNGQAVLGGTIANQTSSDKTYNLKVDFLDKAGNVVASATQTVGPLPAQTIGRFSVTAAGQGITAFKYAPIDN